MDIKEIAERVSKMIYVEDGLLLSKFISEKFAEAIIESYKAELLKEVGEPVLYAEFAEDGGWLGDASEYADHLEEPHALFTSDQVAAAIAKATKPLEDQLAKAEQLWQIAQGRCDGLEEKLAKAEQRVAEWQPISTAPKDGTIFLCCGGLNNNPKNGWFNTVCWWNGYGFVDDVGDVNFVTHWMPLPKAPNGASS